MKKIFLIDGTALIFRGYYAFIGRPLTNSKGENTSAIFGTLRILFQIIKDYSPDKLICAFDVSRDTFRREWYPEYKAHREEAPEDLKAQIPKTLDLLKTMGIPVVAERGFEADDIIGTLAEQLKADNDVYIVSSDKDLMQLVDENVKMIRPTNKLGETQIYSPAEVKMKMGVTPAQIADFLGIVGDKSDNIPGVKGIGEKGAAKLLNEYKDMEEIYNHIDDIKGAAQTKLIQSKDNALLSKKLAVIKRDMEIDSELSSGDLDLKNMSNPEAIKLLEEHEFRSLINELRRLSDVKTEARHESKPSVEGGLFGAQEESGLFAGETPLETMNGVYKIISNENELSKLAGDVREKGLMSVDTETTARHPADADLVGISVSLEEKEGFYIPLMPQTEESACLDKELVFRYLKPLLEDEAIKKIGQNIKYEVEMFRKEGVELRGIGFDTMVAAYLINPTRSHNNMDSLAEEYLNYKTVSYKEIVPKGKTILDVPLAELADYACEDSDITLRLYHKLMPLIESADLKTVFYDIELPLIPVLAKMELNGVLIDTDGLKKLSSELADNLKVLKKEIYELAGEDFNINSPKQLSKILFEKLNLEPVKKTATGKPSTDEEVLNVLALSHPLPRKIVEFRTYGKLKNTYVDALPELISSRTGRIHSSFNQTITATGRLSSSDPNLQNIPIRDKIGDDIGKRIREAFIADEGKSIVSADYSQVELRVLAHFSDNETMRQAFRDGEDIHRHTASLVFGIPESEVDSDMRRRAKSVNFGIIYGLQAYGLSRQLGISVGEARDFIESYYRSFPEVRGFMESTLEDVKQAGEVRTLFGRYRKFPSLKGRKSKNSRFLNAAERMAINTRIQGTAADIMKLAMIAAQKELETRFPDVKMLMQIHDELVFEVPDAQAEAFAEALKTAMENAANLSVPLTVDIGVAKNWAGAH